MSRVIKVDDNVYNQLDQLRGKGETYSMAVECLLNARLKMLELISVLEGQIKYREWQDERLKALSAVDR